MDIQPIKRIFPIAIQLYNDARFLKSYPLRTIFKLLPLVRKSKSQLRQDLFVLAETNFKKGGFFVEFGATNGKDLSNTYLLEGQFAWRGILSEPAKTWHNKLRANRPNCSIEESCVWSDSGSILDFHETNDPELSTIGIYGLTSQDHIKSLKIRNYSVHTISLNELLKKHKAPKYIDYLSIDTEGSEFEILTSFNFSDYCFGVISCEHNYGPNRNAVFELLIQNGYSRKSEKFSKFDDWYTKD